MKNIFLIFWFLYSLLMHTQIVYIPDANFKNALLNHTPTIDTNGDGEIQVVEAEAITETIDVYNKGIIDLTGIEAFVNIKNLYCDHNEIEVIDNLSQISGLRILSATNNNLVFVDVSGNSQLNELYFDYNNISSIDISNNPYLQWLSCAYNNLTELDISNNHYFVDLWCIHNQLTELDVSNQSNFLSTLNCSDNNLSFLDVRNGHNFTLDAFSAKNNPDLTCIYVDDAEYSSENWTNIDPNSTFVETEQECIDLHVSAQQLTWISIHPNPVKRMLYIGYDSTHQKRIIKVFNSLGKLVFKEKTKANELDLYKLNNGIYILTIETDKGIIHKRIVKN